MTTPATALTQTALPAIADSLAAYTNAVNRLPILTAAEEQTLATRLIRHRDKDAARRLVLANLRLVIQVSRNYSGYGLNQSDLIQEGNIGLLKAVRKFDPERGVRLATFAVYWIRAEMHDFIIRNWRIVKIATTKAHRKLFFHKSRLLQRQDGRELDAAVLARELNVKAEEVQDMRRRLHTTEAVALSTEDNDDHPGAESYLADSSPAANVEQTLEDRQRVQALHTALNILTDRERDIITQRRLADPPQTLQILAEKHGLSMERVRQIENASLKKIATHLQAAAA